MRPLGVLLVAALMSATAQAGFEVPRGVYSTDEIEAAQAEAVKKEKSLAFVLSDPKTTCGLCINTTLTAFDKFKSRYVVVLIDSESGTRWDKVSPIVTTGLYGDKMGRIIPKAVVTSPDMLHIRGQMSYEALKDDGAYRDLRKQVDAYASGETPPDNPLGRPIRWPLKNQSQLYIGSFVGLDGKGGLRMKLEEGGQVATIPLSKLTQPCAVLAQQLAGLESKSASPASAHAPAFEAWTGSNGKTIQARFVRVVDDQVTLEMENGKTHTMPLERLAVNSRERAQALQAGQAN